jgi:hypothetical protein
MTPGRRRAGQKLGTRPEQRRDCQSFGQQPSAAGLIFAGLSAKAASAAVRTREIYSLDAAGFTVLVAVRLFRARS